jgi:hypothetical protein
MPRNPAGEMNVSEIRNLVRQHNKMSVIKNVDKKTRATLIADLKEKGYKLDHKNKKIKLISDTQKLVIKQSKKAEPKPQKRTKKKMLMASGDKPVMATKQTVITRTVADKKAKIAEYDRMVKKYPAIPPNIKGRRMKKKIPSSW